VKIEKTRKKIIALIERYCKKKLVFDRPLLPFGAVGEVHAHCTHLQIAQADTRTKIYKRVQFLPTPPRYASIFKNYNDISKNNSNDKYNYFKVN
jgi:hypothetical protein